MINVVLGTGPSGKGRPRQLRGHGEKATVERGPDRATLQGAGEPPDMGLVSVAQAASALPTSPGHSQSSPPT